MTTITATITDKLLSGINDPAGLQVVLHEYSNSKGPLYIALAQATSIMTQKLATVMQQFKEQEEQLQKHQQLLKEAEEKLLTIDQQIIVQSNKMSSLEGKIKDKQVLVDEIKTINGLGIGIKALVKLHDLLVKFGASQGKDPQEITKMFFDYVDKFSDAVFLENRIQQLQTTAAIAKAEAERLQAQATTAEVKTKARKISIDITEKLLSHGAKESDLPHWANIINKCGISPDFLSQELTQFSSIENLRQNRQHQVDNLNTEIISLTAQVNALKVERERVSAAITDIRDNALSQIEFTGQKTRDNLNMLMAQTESYKKLQQEAAELGSIVKLAQLIKSHDPALWSKVDTATIRILLMDIMLWCKAHPSHNPDMETPRTNWLLYPSLYKASLLEVLNWIKQNL